MLLPGPLSRSIKNITGTIGHTEILRNCGLRRGHLLANSSNIVPSKQQNCASSNLSSAGLLPSQS